MGEWGNPAALLLAAGRSTRMAGTSKLLRTLWGTPLVRRAALTLTEAGIRPLWVVVGPDGQGVREALGDLGGLFIVNPNPEKGMASSLAAGVAALPVESGSVLVMLGDMPGLSAVTVSRLIEAFNESARSICLPVHGGRRGHPVLFDLHRHREELLSLTGDRGARDLLARHPDEILEVEVLDAGVLLDIDTEEELGRYQGEGEGEIRLKREKPASLTEALGVGKHDLVSIVGAGGKTSLMYRLTGELFDRGFSAAAATTTRILPPSPGDGAKLLLSDTFEGFEERLKERPTAPWVLGERIRENGKVYGISPAFCDRLVKEGLVEVLVVEADGSRRLPVKAFGPNEPVVPAATTVYVAVVGLTCLGRALGPESAYNHERMAALTGLVAGERITADALARLILDPRGLFAARPERARGFVFLNQADDERLREAARGIAAKVLAGRSSLGGVIIGRLNGADPLEEIWRR